MSDLRWFQGKQLVSFLRKGDYAHAGEEEAITEALSEIPKDNNRQILDVGCGQGGTAAFIQEHGWGNVTGIDIEKSSVDYAKKTYPAVEFYAVNVIDVHNALENRKFDIICLFNSFYAFADQEKALHSLRKLAKQDTQIIIFEYTDLVEKDNPFTDTHDQNAVSIPVHPDEMPEMFKKTGWEYIKMKNLNEKYKQWYCNLIKTLKANRENVVRKFGDEKYHQALSRYNNIYNYLLEGVLGGGIFYAKAAGILPTKEL